MTSDRRIFISPDSTFVVAENGPMRLVIRGWRRERFQTEAVLETAEYAFTCLAQVAGCLGELKGRVAGEAAGSLPPVCRYMCESVAAVGDEDLTPMASVAGAIADEVADYLFKRIGQGGAGPVKVIVDNGGDLAVRLSGGARATVGLRPDLNAPGLSHKMELDSSPGISGVNTSGMGGRSFTRGIASAATVLAPASSAADAAATAIANACFHEDENIVRVPAGQLDPHTDIPDIPVTLRAADLNPETVEKALAAAVDKAETLKAAGLIHGAFIACGTRTAMTRIDHARIVPLAGNRPSPERRNQP